MARGVANVDGKFMNLCGTSQDDENYHDNDQDDVDDDDGGGGD